MRQGLRAERGVPLPYGATPCPQGVNFSVYSEIAEAVRLCLYYPGTGDPLAEITLDPKLHLTGRVWHVHVFDIPEQVQYAWQIKPLGGDWGIPILDPYAKGVLSHSQWGKSCQYEPRGVAMKEEVFDWEQVCPPRHRLRDLVIYEMHVRGFTKDPSSKTETPGSYLSLIEKIPYLKKLGINAVELLPVQEFNECEYTQKHPDTGEALLNFWGYSTVNFFFPMARYATDSRPKAVIREFKTMVRELHRAGIEVILDVVFNHTAEGNEKGPTLSFRGLDEETYYMLDGAGRYLNFSGCGNTFNCNNAVVRELIRDCLRYWVTEFRIDGFRFDLASILGRGADGTPMNYSPLIDGMSCDPILADCKLIAEAWDAGGLYQVGGFYPHYGRWAEWNGTYRDCIRRFIKGSDNCVGCFATAISGSENLYGSHRNPYHSINFITAHDGFTLHDLVAYNDKHNHGNGEDNRDGCDHNESWNCGEEGASDDPQVIALRQRQMRNFIVALLVAQGVPMLTMGDEYAHSKKGNNNTWCQDTPLNWLQWDTQKRDEDIFRFVRLMIALRHKHPILRRQKFLEPQDIHWHHHIPWQPQWEAENRFLAFTLIDHDKHEDLYVAFNQDWRPANVQLPNRQDGQHWHWVVNTSLKSPEDFQEAPLPMEEERLEMLPYSVIILIAHARFR